MFGTLELKSLVTICLPALVLFCSACTTNLITVKQAQQQGGNLSTPHNTLLNNTAPLPTSTTLTPALMPPRHSYQPKYTHKNIGEYAEQLAMELMRQARQLDAKSRIGVASFVALDASLQQTNALGNQLAESLMREMQAYGIQVVDYKMMNRINVDQEGDRIFSRNRFKLRRADMDYVLAGTMHRNEKGVRVNARIVSLDSQSVVASAKGFIPHFIVNEVVPEYVLIPTP